MASNNTRNATIKVGNDIDHSVNDNIYCVYATQRCIVETAFTKKIPLELVAHGISKYVVRITRVRQLNMSDDVDRRFKQNLDEKYNWYPTTPRLGNEWNVYIEFSILERCSNNLII